MAYIRNPRQPFVWESDDDEPWGKYKADDGTFHDSAREADKHDADRRAQPSVAAMPFSKGYKNRHGKPVSDACGDNHHAECTQTFEKCHCTYRGLHTVTHAYVTIPKVVPASTPAKEDILRQLADDPEFQTRAGLEAASWVRYFAQSWPSPPAAPPSPPSEGRELLNAIRDVIEWEQDYRTRNNLGANPPSPFIRLAVAAARASVPAAPEEKE